MNWKEKGKDISGKAMQKKNRTFLRKTKREGEKRNGWDMRRLRHGSYSVVLTVI